MLRHALAFSAVALLAVACGSADDATQNHASATNGAGGAGGNSGAGGAGGASSTSGTGGGGGKPPLGPPYPIVFAHGFFGFEKFAGLDFVTYFYEVKDHFAAKGEMVYTPAVDPFNDSTYRGEQLIARIEEILAQTGYAKVNIIGHSQGGLDARVVAHERPDLVASVTTVATPHGGTPIADVALKIIGDPNLQAVLDWIVKVVGAPLYDQIGDPTSVSKPLYLFSQKGIAEFNAKYTDSPGVIYASIAGRTAYHSGGSECDAPDAPSFITQFDATLDPVDPLLSLTESMLDGGFGSPYPNDGLVRAKDAKWGKFLGCVPADHLDEVGQLLGDDPGGGNSWRHLPFYDALVAYLRAQGL